MNNPLKQSLIQYLSQFVTKHKLALAHEVLKNRTRFLTVVLENLYQSHNASAVLRSSECFGIQDIHVIEQKNAFQENPEVALGASQWLTISRYSDVKSCLKNLKKQNYRIAAMTLTENSIPLQKLDIQEKTALCFGTEETGLSKEILDEADIFVKIPMQGFTQSFNISVSAAITLFALTEKLHQSKIDWHLTEEEKLNIQIDWLTKIIPNGEMVKNNFIKHYENK